MALSHWLRQRWPNSKDDDLGSGSGGVLPVVFVGLIVVLLVGAPNLATRGLAVGWLAGFIGLRALIGRRRAHPSLTMVAAQLFCLLTVIAAGGILLTSGWSIQFFIAFPLLWVSAEQMVAGIIWNTVLGAVVGVGSFRLTVADGADPAAALQTGGLFGVGATVFSAFIAVWIIRLARLSEQHRLLVAELQNTRAELANSEPARGVSEERTRLTSEIHDTLAQGFTSIAMLAQAARAPGADLAARLDQIEDAARDGLRASRQLIAGTQEQFDLPASVRRLAQQLAARTGIEVRLTAPGWQSAGARLDVVLLRCAQEGLHNVEKHATGARLVEVELLRSPQLAQLTVRDDGPGFDTSAPTGFGLAAMRRRVADEGGLFTCDSRPGATQLTIELPIAQKEAQ